MYKNKVVLISTSHCKYCKLVKQALAEFTEIVHHDICTMGEIPYLQAVTPSLYVFDDTGNAIDKLDGAKAQSVYLRFLHKYKHILFYDDTK